jgi:glycosyltransferase involved in cell wall biosynthesis
MTPNTVTLILPTRNEAKNIPALLDTLPPQLPLIVVDTSTDSTPDLITKLRPHNTQVIRHKANVTLARQLGAEAALTPWLLFSDADVTFAPNYFKHLKILYGQDAFYGPKLSQDRYIHYYQWFARGQQASQRLGLPAVSGSNLMIRRTTFQAVGGFDLKLSCNEDSEIGWRIKRFGFRIAFDPALVVYARDHRRLDRGWGRKTLHSLLRCSLLYFNLMPARWRESDWGYWKESVPAIRPGTD